MCCMLAMVTVTASTLLLAGARSSQEEIMRGILAGYDPNTRPGDPALANNSSCTIDGKHDDVSFDFGIELMHTVDQKKRSYKLDGYFRASWRDPRLAFPDSVCRESIVLESPSVGGMEIWTPGFYIQNALHVEMGSGNQGEAFFIQRDGGVFWSRRMRVELSCPSFNFGQFPFDVQYCQITVGVYRYKASQVRISWRDASAENGAIEAIRPLNSEGWSASIDEAREQEKTYASGIYRYAQACLRLKRSPGKYDQKVRISILLVGASYTGFFITPASAPARVALSFLTFLMVMNNQEAVMTDMPPLPSGRHGGEKIWLIDFMFGTTIFNFFTLLEYGLVHRGLEVAAKAQPSLSEPPTATGSARASRVFGSLNRRFWLQCTKLDGVMRLFFPIAYALFCGVMFASLPAYSSNAACIYA